MPGVPLLLMLLGPAVVVFGLLLMRRHDAPAPSQATTEGTVLRWDHRRVGSSFEVRLGWLDRPYAFVVLIGVGLTFLTVVLPVALTVLF